MADRQTYGFVYSGAIGIGFGVFTITDGVVAGQDFAGGTYEGHAGQHVDGIRLSLQMRVEPGTVLVTGTAPQDLPHVRRIEHTFPAEFGNGAPQRLETDFGVMHVMIQRIADEFGDVVSQGFRVALGRA